MVMRRWRTQRYTWVSYPIVYLTCLQSSNFESKKTALVAMLTLCQSGIKLLDINSREDEEINANHALPLTYLHLVVDVSAGRSNTVDFACHPPIVTTLFQGQLNIKETLH